MLRCHALSLIERASRSGPSSIAPYRHFSSASGKTPPLFQLKDALFPGVHSSSSPLSLTINDDPEELWAVVAPHSSSSSGSKLLSRLLSSLSSQSQPQQQLDDSATRLHPSPHLFTNNSRLIAQASFSKQQTTSNAEFQDFSARYGALREEDKVTVFESLMDALGFEVGKIAELKVLPDKLTGAEVEPAEKEQALSAKARIESVAKLLGLDKPGPGSSGGVPLLYSPVISLSNGQLRRARIISSLVRLDEARSSSIEVKENKTLLILDQPYSGLDETSRQELTQLLATLHTSGSPRVILILRRQDEVPEPVTHIIDVDTEGKVWIGSRDNWHGEGQTKPKGVEGIRSNNQNGIGVGKGKELSKLAGVSVQYGDKVVLDSVSLTLREGTRLIVKGANGSGKTTLLSLLNGTHPQSYSFTLDQYALFGKGRSEPSNATRILSQRIGYFGPDLLASFPRKGRDMGGLSIKDAVACGFAGVFSRVTLSQEQDTRVDSLLALFKECISLRDQSSREEISKHDEFWWDRNFIELDSGSQSVVLFLRAVVAAPAIIILDEPFQGMDALQIDRVRHFIDNLGNRATEEGRSDCAVILVSHYINEWPDTMGEYLLLDNGQAIEQI